MDCSAAGRRRLLDRCPAAHGFCQRGLRRSGSVVRRGRSGSLCRTVDSAQTWACNPSPILPPRRDSRRRPRRGPAPARCFVSGTAREPGFRRDVGAGGAAANWKRGFHPGPRRGCHLVFGRRRKRPADVPQPGLGASWALANSGLRSTLDPALAWIRATRRIYGPARSGSGVVGGRRFPLHRRRPLLVAGGRGKPGGRSTSSPSTPRTPPGSLRETWRGSTNRATAARPGARRGPASTAYTLWRSIRNRRAGLRRYLRACCAARTAAALEPDAPSPSPCTASSSTRGGPERSMRARTTTSSTATRLLPAGRLDLHQPRPAARASTRARISATR